MSGYGVPPASGARGRRVAIPEFETLRKLRDVLARGGLRAPGERTPEDHARFVMFETIAALLRLLDEFKRRVEGGERCRLVTVKRSHEPGRLLIENRDHDRGAIMTTRGRTSGGLQ